MRQVTKDSTDISVDIYIIDSTDGTPETGVVFNTSGIDLEYRREGAAVVNITEADLATPALTDAHADGGFLAIGHGLYRLDVPDAAFATGVKTVSIQGTVTGMIVLPQTIQLIASNTEVAGPTKAEMDTGHGLLATEAKQDIIDGIVDNILVDTAVIGTAGAGLTDLGGMSTTMKGQVNAESDTAWTSEMADSTTADGTISTREQAVYAILQILTEFSISGTTMTVKKVDGSTTLMTFTLDDGTNPTSLTRAS